MGKQWLTIFLGSKITADGDCSYEIKICLLFGSKVITNLDKHIEKQRHYFANKGLSSQDYGLSSGRVWMPFIPFVTFLAVIKERAVA